MLPQPALGVDLDVRPIRSRGDPTAAADVVISTLPPRAADGLAGELAASGARTPGVLLDVAYDPWPSLIASAWQAGGGSVVPDWKCCSTRQWNRCGFSRPGKRLTQLS